MAEKLRLLSNISKVVDNLEKQHKLKIYFIILSPLEKSKLVGKQLFKREIYKIYMTVR